MKCPRCKSTNASTQRRMDGDSQCLDCGYRAKTTTFQAECTDAYTLGYAEGQRDAAELDRLMREEEMESEAKSEYKLQSVRGRWCERSIDNMEHDALVHITNEVHAISGDMGLVALLSDYIRMGREYGDMMNSDSKNKINSVTKDEEPDPILKEASENIYH